MGGAAREFDSVANPIATRCLGWQRSIDHTKRTVVASPIATRCLGWQRSIDHKKRTGVANPIATRCLGWQRSIDKNRVAPAGRCLGSPRQMPGSSAEAENGRRNKKTIRNDATSTWAPLGQNRCEHRQRCGRIGLGNSTVFREEETV
jgi:hypothetical protein